jgi:hypothetical protein
MSDMEILRQLRWNLMSSSHGLQVKILANSPLCFRLKGTPETHLDCSPFGFQANMRAFAAKS